MRTKTKNNTRKLSANDSNPRVITDAQLAALRESVIQFGDLSGVVYNRKSGKLVGGHQRVKAFTGADDKVKFEVADIEGGPTAQGTVAEGFVIIEGQRFVYREVDWDKKTEVAAMIAANRHGGDWDYDMLRGLMDGLPEQLKNLTGWDQQARALLEEWQSNVKVVERVEASGAGLTSKIIVECPTPERDAVLAKVKEAIKDFPNVVVS
jgi:hypothetical protein